MSDEDGQFPLLRSRENITVPLCSFERASKNRYVDKYETVGNIWYGTRQGIASVDSRLIFGFYP